MSGQTRRLGDREIETYTDVLGRVLLFIAWSEKQCLIHTDPDNPSETKYFASEESAKAMGELLAVDIVLMDMWREHFADEPTGWLPCGNPFAPWKAQQDAKAS